MKKKSYGGLVVVLFVGILALSLGAVFGMGHVGEDLSKEILPTSLTRSSDVLQKIDEKSFVPENITVKYQTQTKVKQVNKTNTTTNYTVNYTDDNKQYNHNYSVNHSTE